MSNTQFATESSTANGLPGERVMPHAPWVRLPSGMACIPQHYVTYQHDLASLTEIASRVSFDDHTLVFASQDDKGMYVQIGMIGRENYDRGPTVRPRKLVYGRKWRIDADTPSSEIVQTIYLAIKKAREHEVRELLTIRDARSGATSAALSNHQDLPLLAQNREWLTRAQAAGVTDQRRVQQVLSGLRFAERALHVTSLHFFGSQAWVEVEAGPQAEARAQEGDLAEFADLRVCVHFDPAQPHQLIYALMDALIQHSDRHVDETFCFDGFARFSRRIDPRLVAQLSIASRPYRRDQSNTTFYSGFQKANYDTDASRAPQLGQGALARRNRQLIEAHANLLGHMPRGL
ncbi:MAG: hypothetical protein ACK4F8_14155 [Aquabacterium sp.]